MVAAAIFTVAAAIQTGVENIAGLVVGRVLAGVGVGLVSMMVPL